MKHYILNVLNEDLLLKQNVQTCMELIRYDSVWVRMKRSKQRYHDQAIEIMTGQAMANANGAKRGAVTPLFCLRKNKMFDFLQKVMGTLPTARLSFGLGSGLIECKLNPVLLLEFDEMQDHWGFFENTGGMQILIVTRGSSRFTGRNEAKASIASTKRSASQVGEERSGLGGVAPPPERSFFQRSGWGGVAPPPASPPRFAQETALLFSGLLEESNKNPNLLCHQIE